MNLTHQEFKITTMQRGTIKGHKPLTIWMSGLSGSGKSTIANLVEIKLNESFSTNGANEKLAGSNCN